MRIKFHGSRGSFPVSNVRDRVPEIIKNTWELVQKNPTASWEQFQELVTKQPYSKFKMTGGSTTCLEIKSANAPIPIFIDAGTGLSAAGMDSSSALNSGAFKNHRGKVAFFFTHTHWDHIIGIPTLPQIYKLGNQFHFYGVHRGLEKRVATLFSLEFFPVPFDVVKKNFEFHQIALNKFVEIGDVKVEHQAQSHPGGSFAYKVNDGKKSIVFATDIELMARSTKAKLRPLFYSNTDALILDSHFFPEDYIEGYGHNHYEVAVDFAVEYKTKALYLFHLNPLYSDERIEKLLKLARFYLKDKYPDSTLEINLAEEGAEFEI